MLLLYYYSKVRSVKPKGGETLSVPRKKKDDPTPPARKISISLPDEIAEWVEESWRSHVLRDGALTRNVSQFVADILRREKDRRAKTKRQDS
jgi:hypothetical protein